MVALGATGRLPCTAKSKLSPKTSRPRPLHRPSRQSPRSTELAVFPHTLITIARNTSPPVRVRAMGRAVARAATYSPSRATPHRIRR